MISTLWTVTPTTNCTIDDILKLQSYLYPPVLKMAINICGLCKIMLHYNNNFYNVSTPM